MTIALKRGETLVEERLTANDFRFVEKLLYEYKSYDSAIRALEEELDDMMPSASASVVSFDHNTANLHPEFTQPEKWAIKRNESLRGKQLHSRVREKRRHRDAIKRAREMLSDTENQLVWLKYDLEKRPRECWQAMRYEKSRWYEIREQVVYKVAKFLGLL